MARMYNIGVTTLVYSLTVYGMVLMSYPNHIGYAESPRSLLSCILIRVYNTKVGCILRRISDSIIGPDCNKLRYFWLIISRYSGQLYSGLVVAAGTVLYPVITNSTVSHLLDSGRVLVTNLS